MDKHAGTCRWCQAAALAASHLRFKRLGKHERRVLLSASPPGASPKWIVPPAASQPAQTATRRAVARLVELKLILVVSKTARVKPTDSPEIARLLAKLRRRYMVLRYATRTPLGHQVFEHYGAQLKSGDRIRWLDHLDEVTEATLAECPYR